MHPVYNELVTASTYGEYGKLRSLHHNLIVEKMKLDKFFTLYLDRFSDKMDPKNPDTNVWKLYRKKTKEYADLEQVIKAADYFIKKNHV